VRVLCLHVEIRVPSVHIGSHILPYSPRRVQFTRSCLSLPLSAWSCSLHIVSSSQTLTPTPTCRRPSRLLFVRGRCMT
jgi:hypothetical protein